MQFSQENRKLFKIFNQIKENGDALNDKANEKLILEFFRQSSKTQIPIHDTGWIAKAPDPNGITTIHQNDLLPETLTIQLDLNLEIPDVLLPYVEPVVLIKNPPDSTLSVYPQYLQENWTGNFYRVKGDGTNIYVNNADIVTVLSTFTDQQIADMGVSSSHTKKAWFGSFNSGATQGHISDVFWTKDFGSFTDSFSCDPINNPAHEILDMDASGFTGRGNQTIVPDEGDPTFNENITLTKSWSDADLYSILIRFGIRIFKSEITDQVFTFINNYLYYSQHTQRQFQCGISADDWTMTGFPDSSVDDILPYTSINAERNPDGFPIAETEFATQAFTFLYTEAPVFASTEIHKKYTFWRIEDPSSNTFAFYRMKLLSGITLLSPASVDDVLNPTVTTQNDIYTVVGTTYSRTTNTVGAKTNGTYRVEAQDVQYRVMLVVNNPLFYQEVRKYNNEQ